MQNGYGHLITYFDTDFHEIYQLLGLLMVLPIFLRFATDAFSMGSHME